MRQLAEYTLEELMKDRDDSLRDIEILRGAIRIGFGNRLMAQNRIEQNREIIAVIDGELKRRDAALAQAKESHE